MENSNEIIITRHAYQRMKERNGWNRKAATRMANIVFSQGLNINMLRSELRDWIRISVGLFESSRDYILYGERVYVFSENTMITTLRLYHNNSYSYYNMKDKY